MSTHLIIDIWMPHSLAQLRDSGQMHLLDASRNWPILKVGLVPLEIIHLDPYIRL